VRKVKNWRGSTAAKIIAWIALSASALCFVFSAVGVIFMFDEGIYRNSKDETRKQWFENVSYEYGLSAVDDVRREQPAGSVESKYFKYGIIKADSLEGIDLNDEKSYAERNFSDKISLEDVYTNSVELSDEDQIVYTNGNFLTGGGVQLMYSGDNSWVSVYADRVCYDEAKGVFVYLAGNEYYPVQTIETDIDGYGSAVFTYDTERKMYLFEHTDGTGDAASAERTVTDETLTDAVSVERMAADVALTDAADGDTVAESTEERMKSERFKTELITNVSHDIKTPLTSIINYVDLLEKEDLHNETAQEYLEVLERQSSRLKKLIEDLIEASKASTGNLPVHLERLEAGIFMTQTVGEFEEKTKEAGLDLVIEKPETPVYIMADSRHFWRVIDNLMNNICKYAQSGTRVYINLEVKEAQVSITFRNTSKYPLNISSDELMERFVRGDASRNTEGSGLGLSIANSLMDLMGGTFRLYVDGDLFKVVLGFAETAEKETKEKIEEL